MIIKSIRLENIRSYTSQRVDFPQGSVLLSGDIGSGKSTILLAIEFALFGSKPSELPASSLLRHGKKEGSVELLFEVDGREFLIKRTLKDGKQGIKQETGYIISNGMKKELSPVEMKAEIFGLLGYPSDLVSKGKDLIYRYTVYTPQEEMKRILMEDKDARLNTLRKVFNIDKYRRIRENAAMFMKMLREKKRMLEGFISDLEGKKKEREKVNRELEEAIAKIESVMPKCEEAKQQTARQRESFNLFAGRIKELNELKRTLAGLDAELRSFAGESKRNSESIEAIKRHIEAFEKEIGKEIVDENVLKERIRLIDIDIKNLKKSSDEAREKINEFRIVKNRAEQTIRKVSEMDKCPMCLQNVEHTHKKEIADRENKSVVEAEAGIKSHYDNEKSIMERIDILEKERGNLARAEARVELEKLRRKNLEEKKDNKMSLERRQEEIKGQIENLESRKMELNSRINMVKDVEEDYRKANELLEKLLAEEKKLEIEKTGLEKDKLYLIRLIEGMDSEIWKKTEAKEKLAGISGMQNWVEEFFVNLMGTMEKHVMLKVHREFSSLFREWFSVLIEDENISVNLDDDFAPIVQQNGYETGIESLSGGEKTAVALSYRLALNKVINDVVSGIKTKDILILDEPTDGFSSEQLDKVRDVLDQLRINQVIIVSHEAKIESFVDTVIRVGKREHVSAVV